MTRKNNVASEIQIVDVNVVQADSWGEGLLVFNQSLDFSGSWLGNIISENPQSHLIFKASSQLRQGNIKSHIIEVFGVLEHVTIECDILIVHPGSRVIGHVTTDIIDLDKHAFFDGEIKYKKMDELKGRLEF